MITKNTKKLENAHVAFWLLKDTSWCQHWIYFGLIIAVPTFLLSVKIAWDCRRDIGDLIHNLAVVLWITANIVWMIGEFFFDDGTRGIAKFLFFAGIALISVYYTWCSWKWASVPRGGFGDESGNQVGQ